MRIVLLLKMLKNLSKFSTGRYFQQRFGVVFFIAFWVIINVVLLAKSPFDPYPFILLNLFLSMLASVQAPIIMMSQIMKLIVKQRKKFA